MRLMVFAVALLVAAVAAFQVSVMAIGVVHAARNDRAALAELAEIALQYLERAEDESYDEPGDPSLVVRLPNSGKDAEIVFENGRISGMRVLRRRAHRFE